jgi:curli biogenesis system outer membrane secretion channel CsgG
MRRTLATLLVLATALVAAPAADAARTLEQSAAARHAERAAAKLARQNSAIAAWEIARGFKFSSRKWVFVWWAEMADGSVCSAQLVTRYASMKSYKVVSYFRNEECS